MRLFIDPGVGGAIVCDGEELSVMNMPKTLADLHLVIGSADEICTEEIGWRKGDGKFMLELHKNYWRILDICELEEIPIEKIPPKTWQKHYGLVGGHKNYTEKKKKHYAKAKDLMKDLKVTQRNCDAILLYLYKSAPTE